MTINEYIATAVNYHPVTEEFAIACLRIFAATETYRIEFRRYMRKALQAIERDYPESGYVTVASGSLADFSNSAAKDRLPTSFAIVRSADNVLHIIVYGEGEIQKYFSSLDGGGTWS